MGLGIWIRGNYYQALQHVIVKAEFQNITNVEVLLRSTSGRG